MDRPDFKQKISYQALLLGGFSALATLLLVIGNLTTSDAIAQRQREDLLASLGQVIPADQYTNDLLNNTLQIRNDQGEMLTVYRGLMKNRVNALAYEIHGEGYAGKISLILGLDANGKILGVRVLSHAETPGLGDKIETAKDDWILGFNGLSLTKPKMKQWAVKKDGGQFDSFSGATITPRAVVAAIKTGLEFFDNHQTALLHLSDPDSVQPIQNNEG